MATPAWDGEHDQPPNILQSFLTLSWKGIRSLAEFLVMRVVMLGLPSSYEARLKKLESSCGELLGVGLNPAETTMFQDVVKGCVFEWRECAVLNAAVLGLIGVLFSMTPDAPVWRMLLYLAFAVAFWALVIGKIYLAYFRHLQDSGEGGRWLFRARRTMRIYTSSFLAFPALWTTWALLLFGVSFLSYVWTSPGELSNSSPSTRVPDSSQLPGHTSHFWAKFLPTAVFAVALWNIWAISKVMKEMS